MDWLIPVLVGAATGVLSGFGVGGGTLLLIYMTAFAGMDQALAQGINLLYFLPAAATALPSHVKHGYIDKAAIRAAIPAGMALTALAAWLSTAIDVLLLRRCFGVFLLYIGLRELLQDIHPGGQTHDRH